ncbi:hypothetical protein RB623_24265 [Mesorhizobium sp. LHD-90]|uniref:hypothetical protein n=1 Tax=Mesorhizobium sp. LHD-90 TaxID=3071414 RepID=UPI0027E000C0|nr:hypothetical protein [Mesorhizobium sp. LHD-90]MDQ6437180.1 hypothetical protein [Mesorhizobium sp. LHD-90]
MSKDRRRQTPAAADLFLSEAHPMLVQPSLFETLPAAVPPGIDRLPAKTAAAVLLAEPCRDCLKPAEIRFLRKMSAQWLRVDSRQRRKLTEIVSRLRKGPPVP